MQVGVIGTGHLGRQHARVYAELLGPEHVGIHDIDAERAAVAAAGAGSCRQFASLEALLDACDAASICVPTPQHAAVTHACLEAGLDVLVEKPITDDLGAARSLRDLAQSGQRILQVGHIERFNPAMLAAAAHLHQPRFVECHRLASFGVRGSDVPVVLDLMIHDLDLLLAVIGGEVQSIEASGVSVLSGNTDIANARLRFRTGCVANVTASRISFERMRKMRFFQSDSYISVDLLKEQVAMYRRRADADLAAIQAELQRGVGPDMARFVEPVGVEVVKDEPLRRELAAFVDAVRSRRPPVVGAEAGIRALEVAFEIERLLREGS
jgi:predicted dehydrogenase